MKKWRKRQNPYGVSRPMDRLALAMIYLGLGILPKREEMDRLAVEAGISLHIADPGPSEPTAPDMSRPSQGPCETTLTERFENPNCRCDTYEGNLGPCRTFEVGANGLCVFCDHEEGCHHG